jgi:serine/threonine-protein kinase
MAVVYLARDRMLERSVAVKILKQDFSTDDAFRERFRQEARSAANLSHPNIVTVHDFGMDGDNFYFVMEHMPGKDLKTIIRERGRFPVKEAVNLIIQAAEGLGYAHRAGLVHCDVKPQNFLVSPDQQLKVTDFGIARALSTIHPEEKSDVIWGTPQYFSPEQASGLAPSPASDVYSLGVILYEMLAGRLPFIADDSEELARMHREEDPIPPRRINPQIPERLEKVILKVLSKEPSARYRTADQFARILKTLMLEIVEQATIPPVTFPPEPVQAVSYVPPKVTLTNHTPSQPSFIPPAVNEPLQEVKPVDWITILLGLGAALAVGGLIPFGLYVWFTLSSQ